MDEPSDEVGGHEEDFALLIVLVVSSPDRPALSIEGVPESFHSLVVVGAVGVGLLPGIHDERGRVGLVEDLERMLGLLLLNEVWFWLIVVILILLLLLRW